MKPTRLLILLLALSLVLAACSSSSEGSDDVSTTSGASEDTSGSSEENPGEDTRTGVNLRFAIWVGGPVAELYQEQADAFAAQDPRVDSVEVVIEPFDRYHDVLNIQLANNSAPDVFWLNDRAGGQYVAAGRTLDLTPILEAEGVDLSDFPEQALDAWRLDDGGLYGIPYVVTPMITYINKDLWAAAGLEDPDDTVAAGNWDWEYVADAAKTMVDSGVARFGASFHPATWTLGAPTVILEDLWSPYGGTLWDETGTECLMNSPEMVDATTLLHRMVYTDESMPGPGTTPDFPAGDVGLMLNRPRLAFDVGLDEAGFEWTVVPNPAGPAGWRPGIAHGGLGVYRDSPNGDIAAELAIHLTSVESLTEMSPLLPPARLSLQSVEVLGPVNPLFTDQQIEDTIIAAINEEDSNWGYTHPYWGPVATALNKSFDELVMTPDANVPEALDGVCGSIDSLLKG